MFDSVTGSIDNTVQRWVHDLINGLYGFLHLIFGVVGAAWEQFMNSLRDIEHGLGSFIDQVGQTFYHLYRAIIPAIIREYRRLYADVLMFAQRIYHDLLVAIQDVRQFIDRLIHDVEQWVITDIWRPLLRSLTAAWDWIGHQGDTLWYYLTHPPALIDLLWDHLIAKLEAEAWNVAEKLGKFALSLVYRNVVRFAHLIVDIVDAIL